MADEEFGDLNLNQYGVGGRWLQSSNPSWMRYGHEGTAPQTNVSDRYTSQKTGGYDSESAASLYSRTPVSGSARGRSGHYYSPPGTSYTIIERPVAAPSINQQYESSSNQKYSTSAYHAQSLHSHSSRSASKSTGTKRPMSPEEVLKMFGSSAGKGKSCARRSQSPASSPPSTTHRHYLYQNTHDDMTVRTVTMVRQPESSHGFGICVKGGKDSDSARPGVYISRVEEGSIAERVGLKPGDSILEVNGTPFSTISHEEALKMLKSCRKLSMTVQSPNIHSQPLPTGGPWLVRQSYSWMDREGRPVSPPLEYARAAPPPVVNPRWVYTSRTNESGGSRKVDLNIEPGQSLGLMIRGGLEYNLGIFVTGVDKDSVAERAGLMVGDQILEVNGQSFLDVTHDEAVNQLKIHKRMSLLVRDVGKVPHSCTAYDDYLWQPCFSNSSTDQMLSGKDCCPALQMVEEKARVLLNRNEMSSLSYYQEEYTSRHMTIEAFVTVLLELLNTPEKNTLLTEIRELIFPEDRVRFDDLVYRRGHLDTDRHGHRRKGCEMATPATNPHDFHHSNEYFGTSRPCKIPVLVEGLPLETEGFNTPSEDSGVCLGDGRTNERAGWLAATSPGYRKQTSDLSLSNGDCSNISQSGYLEGLKSQFDGWTQRVKSWYWGRPLELTHKLSRSFDMKEEQRHLDSGNGNVRRHQSMQRLSRSDASGTQEEEDSLMGPMVVPDQQGNLRVTVSKTKPILGIAIEGGANTRHPLPRIINIHAKLETKALKAKRPGFTDDRYNETSYYIENGLRKVYPYYFTFTTFTKGRWVGEKILDVFSREFRAHPAEEYERCIRAGTLTVNYEKVDTDYKLKHNDLLANIVHRHEVPVTSDPITIVHVDEDVVVVNKPASIPVHPCGRYRHNTVVFILAKEYNLKNLRTIHRLDRLTSGLLLFGRSPKKARQMEHQIRNRQVHKEYVCRVEGEFPSGQIECTEPIEVVSYKIGVCKVSSNGKSCNTAFEKLGYNPSTNTSVVLCKPVTGRMHQIRVHLQYLGYPVVNDPLYNHTVFGPEKGKGGNIGKSDEDLIRDLINIHNAENWLGMEGDSELSMFKTRPDLDDSLNSLNRKGSSSPVDDEGDGSREPSPCGGENSPSRCSLGSPVSLAQGSPSTPSGGAVVRASKVTVATQTGHEAPDLTFQPEKMTTDPHCYECKVRYRDPKPKDLVMYLHAWKYRGPGWEYETELPDWAKTDWVEPEE